MSDIELLNHVSFTTIMSKQNLLNMPSSKNKKLAIYCQAVGIKLSKIDIGIIGRCYPRYQFNLVECKFPGGVKKTRSKVSEEASKALLDDRLVP